jgi:hypothetical protein
MSTGINRSSADCCGAPRTLAKICADHAGGLFILLTRLR